MKQIVHKMRRFIPVIRKHIVMDRDEQVCSNSYAKIGCFTVTHIADDPPSRSRVIATVDWQHCDMGFKLTYTLQEPVRNRGIPTVIDAYTIDTDAVAKIVVISM